MRIKIIGDNNCARATRHLLRLAGFAVTEYLPVDAVTSAPHSGYAITIDLAPAPHTPDSARKSLAGHPSSKPEQATHGQPATTKGEALSSHGGASSRLFAESLAAIQDGKQAEACSTGAVERGTGSAHIHFDSVDSVLEAAVLRHVTQLAAGAVIVDRPGGVVHSERELRIVVPCTADEKADEAAAVAVEFGVLRGLLDLTSLRAKPNLFGRAPANVSTGVPSFNAAKNETPSRELADAESAPGVAAGSQHSGGRKKKWWTFGVVVIAGFLVMLGAQLAWGPRVHAASRVAGASDFSRTGFNLSGLISAPAKSPRTAALTHVLAAPRAATNLRLHAAVAYAAPEPQGQFVTGQATDPCRGETKLYASINQTANTQIVAGTASRKIYICSIHVVVATATNVALVEGTGSVCGTGTAGVNGFGGATAATGWNFAANGGIAFGSGDAAVGAEGMSADNLCVFNSGSGQVSGGLSYAVQ
jgi:hypothetical protein